MKGESDVAHFVYRLWNASGVLLYVGCTKDPEVRFRGLACERRFFAVVARAQVVRYESRDAALAAERTAISEEAPRYNVQWNGPVSDSGFWQVLLRRGAVNRGEIPRPIAMATGVLAGMTIFDPVSGTESPYSPVAA